MGEINAYIFIECILVLILVQVNIIIIRVQFFVFQCLPCEEVDSMGDELYADQLTAHFEIRCIQRTFSLKSSPIW